MRLIACLLLSSGLFGAVFAEDLAEVVGVVEAREAATAPFFVAYRFRDIEPARSFAATLAFDRQGGRGHFMARGGAYDRVQAWGPDSTVLLLRAAGGWEGVHQPGPILPEEITPIDFGLSVLALLRHPNSRVAGDARLGERDCLLVENRDPQLPIRLWLEKRRGYFPVQVIHFRAEEKTWKRRECSFVREGTRFVPAAWVVVDELVGFGDGGWFPVRGRQIDCMAPAGAGEYRADKTTLRAAVQEDFELPGPRTVRNEITGGIEEQGRPRRRWMILLLGGSCAALFALWVLSRWRRS